MTVVIHYVTPDFVAHEYFVGWVHCKKINGLNLSKLLLNFVASERIGLNLNFLRGQEYDGAGNMSGKKKGLAARIRRKFPLAWYFHCAGHILNLAVAGGRKLLGPVRAMLDILDGVYLYFILSLKRLAFLMSQDGDGYKPEIKGLCKTRWAIRVIALLRFRSKLEAIVGTLDKIELDDEYVEGDADFDPPELEGEADLGRDLKSEEEEEHDSTSGSEEDYERDHWNDDSKSKAGSLLRGLRAFAFIVTLITTLYCWEFTRKLTHLLQGPTKDIFAAYGYIDTVIARLQKCRSEVDDVFQSWYAESVELALTVGVEPSKPRTASRQRNRPNTPSDSIEEYWKRTVCIPLLDSLLCEIKSRFAEQKSAIRGGLLLIPSIFSKGTGEAASKDPPLSPEVVNNIDLSDDSNSGSETEPEDDIVRLFMGKTEWIRDVKGFAEEFKTDLPNYEKLDSELDG
jgi:hypothetical protein